MLRARHYTTHIQCICYYVQGRGRLGAPPSPDRCRLTKRGETRSTAVAERRHGSGRRSGGSGVLALLQERQAPFHTRRSSKPRPHCMFAFAESRTHSALLGATAAIVGNSCNGAQLTDVKKKGQITFLAEVMSIFSYLM